MSDRRDAIVIGAGINGAGIFREAAMRGLSVLLLEKNDLGGATTATSSSMTTRPEGAVTD